MTDGSVIVAIVGVGVGLLAVLALGANLERLRTEGTRRRRRGAPRPDRKPSEPKSNAERIAGRIAFAIGAPAPRHRKARRAGRPLY